MKHMASFECFSMEFEDEWVHASVTGDHRVPYVTGKVFLLKSENQCQLTVIERHITILKDEDYWELTINAEDQRAKELFNWFGFGDHAKSLSSGKYPKASGARICWGDWVFDVLLHTSDVAIAVTPGELRRLIKVKPKQPRSIDSFEIYHLMLTMLERKDE